MSSSQRAANPGKSLAQYVGVYLRSTQIRVTEQFLNSANVTALSKQFRCKGMPKGVAAGTFADTGFLNSVAHGLLYGRDVQVMPRNVSLIIRAER